MPTIPIRRLRTLALCSLLTFPAACGGGGSSTSPVLVATSMEPPGGNCAAGGARLDSGLDGDGDGTLAPEEIDLARRQFICNGSDGSDGDDGAAGAPGAAGPQGPQGPAAA